MSYANDHPLPGAHSPPLFRFTLLTAVQACAPVILNKIVPAKDNKSGFNLWDCCRIKLMKP